MQSVRLEVSEFQFQGTVLLIDEQGKLIDASNQEGELIYHGTNVSMGYSHSRFDLNKDNENNGTIHTGDIAKKDLDGYIVGRKRDLLKFLEIEDEDEAESLLNKNSQLYLYWRG